MCFSVSLNGCRRATSLQASSSSSPPTSSQTTLESRPCHSCYEKRVVLSVFVFPFDLRNISHCPIGLERKKYSFPRTYIHLLQLEIKSEISTSFTHIHLPLGVWPRCSQEEWNEIDLSLTYICNIIAPGLYYINFMYQHVVLKTLVRLRVKILVKKWIKPIPF